MRVMIVALLVLVVAFLIAPFTHAQDPTQEFKTDYDAAYTLPANPQDDARVRFKIVLTNLKADTYVDTYSLTFPSAFEIGNVTATDDEGSIDPIVTQNGSGSEIQLRSNSVEVGHKAVTTFVVEFTQKHLFRRTGSVWEVILPTVETKGDGTYKVSVQVPPDGKTVSIAKPKPTRNEGGTIYWENPKEKTIYAVFGPKQSYKLGLTYDIENKNITPQDVSIALPPDTLFQKVTVESLSSEPDSITIDGDGNYLATFRLDPKSSKQIVFNGYADVYAAPRDEVRDSMESSFAAQRKALVAATDYWSLLPSKTIKALKTPEEINNFIDSKFSYDFARTQQGGDRKRYGAKAAMLAPERAVCLEYTDTFIAIARGNGIPAREIQGYAFTDNSQFRPVSLVNDVLHSWPEYYDVEAGVWRQIDPTWQDTSGIDYFNSFDLNHVAFAIHGTSSTDPLPAGMYKTIQRKNVVVDAVEEAPKEIKELAVDVDSLKIDERIDDSRTYEGSFTIRNRGNTFRYNVPVSFQSPDISVEPGKPVIGVIAPKGSAEVQFKYKTRTKGTTVTTQLNASADAQQLFSKQVVITPASYSIALVLGIIVVVVFGTAVIIVRKYVSH